MSRLQELIDQQKVIQAQIEDERVKSKATAVASVAALMREYGLVPADLKLIEKPPVKKVAPKYRDASGNTWSGRGLQPKWLRAAVAAGAPLETFAVA